MQSNSSTAARNRWFWLSGLGIAVLIVVILSPLASPAPDGLDRVVQDHGLAQPTAEVPIAKQLPFAAVFEEYSLKQAPQPMAKPMAGLIGTLVTFGLAWGIGKLATKKSQKSQK